MWYTLLSYARFDSGRLPDVEHFMYRGSCSLGEGENVLNALSSQSAVTTLENKIHDKSFFPAGIFDEQDFVISVYFRPIHNFVEKNPK